MQTFWRYVRIQLVVFLFGIVGPIFLVIFFATRPDPTMKWAYWAGLIIVTIEILLAIGLTKSSESPSQKVSTAVLIEAASARRRGGGHSTDDDD